MQSPDESQREYLRGQIADRLARLNSSIEWYRGRHYKYQSSAVVLSALITVLSGMKLGHIGNHFGSFSTDNGIALVLTDTVLILGATSTVLAAYGAFFSPQQSWYLNAEIYAKMRALQAKLEWEERSPSFSAREEESVKQLFNEYQEIMDEYNQKWQDLRQKSK